MASGPGAGSASGPGPDPAAAVLGRPGSLPPGARMVLKLGSTSLTRPDGGLDLNRIDIVARLVAGLRRRGHDVVLVSSGAVAAGLAPLGLERRPDELRLLQAAASVGQGRLVARWQTAMSAYEASSRAMAGNPIFSSLFPPWPCTRTTNCDASPAAGSVTTAGTSTPLEGNETAVSSYALSCGAGPDPQKTAIRTRTINGIRGLFFIRIILSRSSPVWVQGRKEFSAAR